MEKELLEHLKNKIEMVNHPEQVNHPSHYQFGNDKTYEVIKIIERLAVISENLTYCNNENIQLVSFVSIFQ